MSSSISTVSVSTVLIGQDSLMIECGETLLSKGHRVEAVCSGSERVSAWAQMKALPVIDVTRPADEWVGELAGHQFQWLFAVTYPGILPDVVLELPTEGAVNFHDGPLPTCGGLNAPAWALMRGDEHYGVTWHLMSSVDDEGDIVKVREFEVADGETSLSLNTRNFEAAIESFGELVDEIAAGTLVPVPQDPTVARASHGHLDRPAALALLDWRRSAVELERLVRALTFGRHQNPLGVAKLWNGQHAVLVTAAELVADAVADPGTVLELTDERLVVACSEGALAVTTITTLRGEAIGVVEAAEHLAVAVGDRLALVDDDLVEGLGRFGRSLAIAESHHVRQLEQLDPVELPWARTPTVDHVTTCEVVDVDLDGDPGTVVGALVVLLARLSGKTDFHLGVVVSRESTSAAEAVSSLLAEAVPVPFSVGDDAPISDVVANVAEELGHASVRPTFAHELVARHPSLIQRPELLSGRLVPIGVRIDRPGDLGPGVVVELEQSDGVWRVRYDSGLVDSSDIALFAECLRAVAGAAATSSTVAEVDLLGPELRDQVLERWNETATTYDDACVHQLFERQADRTPDLTAVIFEDRSITYLELDQSANRLAHHLVSLGVGADGLVGVHVSRGIDLLVAVMAVHKAGGAYVPLDPMYPSDRLEHMIRDSGCRVILTDSAMVCTLPRPHEVELTVVQLDADHAAFDGRSSSRPAAVTRPDHLAYCIYTSGSTGLPKGVLVEHRNVVNFFAGMDERVAHELPATWFAVTSLSFDISVLELLYTLTRGFTVVVHLDRDRAAEPGELPVARHADRPVDFSLFYFSGDEGSDAGSEKYRLLLDGARFADQHGFKAVWTPERHFHEFGGLYPQPAVTGAAVAAITTSVEIRAGSVVMPLNHPARVAEAWSIVDNLSNGRVGVSVASGWQPNDFVLMPENYANAKQAMFDGAEQVKQLWRGEAVAFDGPLGEPVEVTTFPRPVQAELPLWVTTAGNPETYVQAGRIGANLLTHLLGQSVEQLGPKIEMYRAARAEGGFDPDAGVVTLMLHTFVGDDDDVVRDAVREPLKAYLGTSFSLLKEYAWSFPAFQRPGGEQADDQGLVDDDFKNLSGEDLDAVLEFAFLRYFETSGLFGTAGRCLAIVDTLKGIGVDEIACLVDFGVDTDQVLDSLPLLAEIRNEANRGTIVEPSPEYDQSVAAQLVRHGVTHLQCTPSMARMFSMHDETRMALAGVQHLFVGGEAFPVALANDLLELTGPGRVTNMYGPTETTIWSTTWPVTGPIDDVPIGTPIANTRIYILDKHREPLPPGVAGELWIGGDGVVRGYHERPELTAERFVPDPFRPEGHRMYLTGDLARWGVDEHGHAVIEFLGRIDHQVKIRGYRIELGEIEAQLGVYPGVRECVAVVREDTPGNQQLVAYLSAGDGVSIDPMAVREHLREHLPEVMVPAHVSVLADLPHTPNGKIDRNRLPSLSDVMGSRVSAAPPAAADSDLERDVLEVWTEMLGIDGIGVDDNFFDIGGHSLLVVRMHRRLKELLERPIALTELYRFPTVRSFAASLESDQDAAVVQTGVDRAARRRETMQRRRARR